MLETFHAGIPGIKITIPRTVSQNKNLKEPELIRATVLASHRNPPTISHLIPLPKADSVLMIEIKPTITNQNLNLFLSFEKIPTFRSFMFTTVVSTLPESENEGDNVLYDAMVW